MLLILRTYEKYSADALRFACFTSIPWKRCEALKIELKVIEIFKQIVEC